MNRADATDAISRLDAIRAEMTKRSERIVVAVGRSPDLRVGSHPIETVLRRLRVGVQFARHIQVLAEEGIEWKEYIVLVAHALHLFAAVNRAGDMSQIRIKLIGFLSVDDRICSRMNAGGRRRTSRLFARNRCPMKGRYVEETAETNNEQQGDRLRSKRPSHCPTAQSEEQYALQRLIIFAVFNRSH